MLRLVLAFLALISVVLANPTATSKISSSSKDCKSGEFFYNAKSCCLPHGGPSKPPSPPPQKQCPPTSWYWSYEVSCCVPSHLPPKGPQPPPQCNTDWQWSDESQCCEPHQSSNPPKPSSKPNNKDSHGRRSTHSRHKSVVGKSRDEYLCPRPLRACPLTGLVVPGENEYECLDTYTELTSCGGCSSTGEGQNCAVIEGAWNVGCEFGTCKVYTCADGFARSRDGLSCISV